MIKPDAVQRGLVGDIIKRFEQKGFKLVGLKFKQAGGGRLIPAHPPRYITDSVFMCEGEWGWR